MMMYEEEARLRRPLICGYKRIERRGKRLDKKKNDQDYNQPSEKKQPKQKKWAPL